MPSPNSTDSGFERTFADLAYARLRDKAPTLLDFLVGFQLIDKNDDETHAVGVFGFKVGTEWVYAPVFFINGELKGHELMYIKNQDAFVPMTEEWVNYVLNRRPSLLGEAEKTPRNKLPLRQPDFDIFSRVPFTGSKYASASRSYNYLIQHIDEKYRDFMPVFTVSPNDTKYAALSTRFSLPHALKALGKKAAFVLLNTMKHDENFADAVLNFYDVQNLVEHEKTAAKMTKDQVGYKEDSTFSQCKTCDNYKNGSCTLVEGKISPDATCMYFDNKDAAKPLVPLDASEPAGTNTGGEKKAADNTREVPMDKVPYRKGAERPVVVILRGDDMTNITDYLSEEDKKKLMKNQYVVKDERSDDQRSRVYRTQLAATLAGPTESGVYDVITGRGERRKLAVLLHAYPIGYGYWRRQNAAVLVDPEKEEHGVFAPNDLLVGQRYGDLMSLSGLKDAKDIVPDETAILVGPNGKSTSVFRANLVESQPDGTVEIHVWGCSRPSATSSLRTRRSYLTPQETDTEDEINRVILTGREGDTVTRIGSALFVPKSWKALRVSAPPKKDSNGFNSPSSRDCDINIGSISDILMSVTKSASENGVRSFKMLTDGIRFHLESGGRQSDRMSKLAMLRHLIVSQGLGQEDAELLLKEAQPRKAQTYWIKYAYHGDAASQPMPPFFPEPMMGHEPNINVPTQYPDLQMQNLQSPDMGSNREFYRDDRFIDESAKRYAQQASQQGQKEVLDTAVITGLVKAMDTDSKVDSYIGDLLLGLDRVGRILFMFYWHNDKFKDRYGQQDMVELEDNLRNVFKNMGELTLFLKQKTIEPDAADSSEAELTEIFS